MKEIKLAGVKSGKMRKYKYFDFFEHIYCDTV